MSLFKLLIKVLCCIMSKVLILLLRIHTVIIFCKSVICIYHRHILYFSLLANYLCQVWLYKLHINSSGDIELNPGPKSNSCKNVSVTCLSETYLDSWILSHDPSLEVQGYDLIRANNPSNFKRGGVCIYYKKHLPLKLININFLLNECLTIGLNIKNKLCVLVALYPSPNQSYNELSSFITNVASTLQAITLRKPFFNYGLGDFNAKNKLWFNQDNTSYEGSGVFSSLHPNCHHQIVFFQF